MCVTFGFINSKIKFFTFYFTFTFFIYINKKPPSFFVHLFVCRHQHLVIFGWQFQQQKKKLSKRKPLTFIQVIDHIMIRKKKQNHLSLFIIVWITNNNSSSRQLQKTAKKKIEKWIKQENNSTIILFSYLFWFLLL